MKRILLISAIMACAALSAPATLVNFDDKGFAPLDDVTTQYQSVGVIFQGFLVTGAPVNVEAADNSLFSDNHPTSLPMDLSNFYNHDKYLRADILRILFTQPTSDIGFQYDGAGSMGALTQFKVYDSAGVLLNTFTVPAASDLDFHPVSVPDVGVGYIDIVSPESGWGHYIDDLTFNQNGKVPDIACTAGLLGLGLAFIQALRRKLS